MVNRVQTVVYWFSYPIFILPPSPDGEEGGTSEKSETQGEELLRLYQEEACRQVEAARTEGVQNHEPESSNCCR